MDEKIPALVLALAATQKMTPIAWSIQPEKVVIVFEQGPKITFDRTLEPEPKAEKTTPAKVIKTPAITQVSAAAKPPAKVKK
jgi:hypothetical protein